ncbi:unannotated protein [freshwater metagenome]|uniref:Unannotated protein n=1 Tax=freshwater metagenome TaxID=449393 RepID=A0A6J6B8I0_9ZZZZ
MQVGVATKDDGAIGSPRANKAREFFKVEYLKRLIAVTTSRFGVQAIHIHFSAIPKRHCHHAEPLHGQTVAGTGESIPVAFRPSVMGFSSEREARQDSDSVPN